MKDRICRKLRKTVEAEELHHNYRMTTLIRAGVEDAAYHAARCKSLSQPVCDMAHRPMDRRLMVGSRFKKAIHTLKKAGDVDKIATDHLLPDTAVNRRLLKKRCPLQQHLLVEVLPTTREDQTVQIHGHATHINVLNVRILKEINKE